MSNIQVWTLILQVCTSGALSLYSKLLKVSKFMCMHHDSRNSENLKKCQTCLENTNFCRPQKKLSEFHWFPLVSPDFSENPRPPPLIFPDCKNPSSFKNGVCI